MIHKDTVPIICQELKPCPFCGAETVDGVITHSNECFIHKLIYQHSADELGKAWQIRTLDPMLEELAEKVACHYCNDELLKEMAGALEKVKEYLDEYRPHGHVLDQIEQALQKYQELKLRINPTIEGNIRRVKSRS